MVVLFVVSGERIFCFDVGDHCGKAKLLHTVVHVTIRPDRFAHFLTQDEKGRVSSWSEQRVKVGISEVALHLFHVHFLSLYSILFLAFPSFFNFDVAD